MEFRRAGLTGIVIGAVAVVACELPLMLAAIGLGGLGAGATWLRPSPIVAMISLALAVIGAFVLTLEIGRQVPRKNSRREHENR